MKDRAASLEFFVNKCEEHDLKMTPQRILIYGELVKSKEHPSADIVFRRVKKIFPHVSFDTVNRTLLTFSKIGIVNLVDGYYKSKRFDPNLEEHHHFRCTKCNNITDFRNRYFNNIRIPQDIQSQFTVLKKTVVIEGVCNECSRKHYNQEGE